jgi:hypothetical protein
MPSSAGEAPTDGFRVSARSRPSVRRPSAVTSGTRRAGTTAAATVTTSRTTRNPTGRPLADPAATRAPPRTSSGTNHSPAARYLARCSGVGARPPRRSRSRTAATAGSRPSAACTSASVRFGWAATSW